MKLLAILLVALPLALAGAERALTLDPTLPEGHLARAVYLYRGDPDIERAARTCCGSAPKRRNFAPSAWVSSRTCSETPASVMASRTAPHHPFSFSGSVRSARRPQITSRSRARVSAT